MSASVSNEVRDLFDRYVRFLDDERYDEWLGLFANDAYYGVITHRDWSQGTNYVIVGERKPKLAERVRAGAREDIYRKMHLLTAITPMPGEAGAAVANFALFKNSAATFCGRYLAWFEGSGDAMRIAKWMVILDSDTVVDTVFLPI